MPGAENEPELAGVENEPGENRNTPVPVGMAERRYAGTVKVPVVAGARQSTLADRFRSTKPSSTISTCPIEPFGFHVTDIPAAFDTVKLLEEGFGVSRIGERGTVRFAVKAPTSLPPTPVTV